MDGAGEIVEAGASAPLGEHQDAWDVVEHRPAAAASPSPYALIERALATGAGIEVVERLMALAERREEKAAKLAFETALAAARGEFGRVVKSRMVDHATSGGGRKTYAFEDLTTIAEAVDAPLARHGLSYRFRTDQEGAVVRVTCILSHADGHSETTTLSGGGDASGGKNSYQAIGSAVTYLQRYTLKAMLGIAAAVDDDVSSARSAPRRDPHEQRHEQRHEPPPASRKVDEHQAAEIATALRETGADVAKFLAFAGVGRIQDIEAAAAPGLVRKIWQAGEARNARQQAVDAEGPIDASGVPNL